MSELNRNLIKKQAQNSKPARAMNDFVLDLSLNKRAVEERQILPYNKKTQYEAAQAPPAHCGYYVRTEKNLKTFNASSLENLMPVNGIDLTLPFDEHRLHCNVKVTITNVVCAFNLGCYVELLDITKRAANVEYKLHQPFLRLRIRNPKVMATIWWTGKVSVMGSTTSAQAYVAARRIARKFQKLDYVVHMHSYRIVNVVASVSMPWAINLESFAMANQMECSLEPELITSAIYRMKEPKCCLFIFTNGSVTLNAASFDKLHLAILILYRKLRGFDKPRTPQQKQMLQQKEMLRKYKKAMNMLIKK